VQKHLSAAREVTFRDLTFETAMIAVQGPKALALAQSFVNVDLQAFGNYSGGVAMISGQTAIASRTGYTGEDGCELIVPAAVATPLWEKLIEAGAKPVGLGARDTLRLEAAMPLYGHELSEKIDPYQAGLSFAVNLANREFIGREALMRLREGHSRPQRIGLQLAGKRVPREHFPVLSGGVPIGEVTSGTFSPTLQKSIAMAYVPPEFAAVGTELLVDIRGGHESAVVVQLPFYARAK